MYASALEPRRKPPVFVITKLLLQEELFPKPLFSYTKRLLILMAFRRHTSEHGNAIPESWEMAAGEAQSIGLLM